MSRHEFRVNYEVDPRAPNTIYVWMTFGAPRPNDSTLRYGWVCATKFLNVSDSIMKELAPPIGLEKGVPPLDIRPLAKILMSLWCDWEKVQHPETIIKAARNIIMGLDLFFAWQSSVGNVERVHLMLHDVAS